MYGYTVRPPRRTPGPRLWAADYRWWLKHTLRTRDTRMSPRFRPRPIWSWIFSYLFGRACIFLRNQKKNKSTKKGSKGIWVRNLQTALKLQVDGTFGKATEAALKAWQKANGLQADGIAGRNTYRALGLLA